MVVKRGRLKRVTRRRRLVDVDFESRSGSGADRWYVQKRRHSKPLPGRFCVRREPRSTVAQCSVSSTSTPDVADGCRKAMRLPSAPMSRRFVDETDAVRRGSARACRRDRRRRSRRDGCPARAWRRTSRWASRAISASRSSTSDGPGGEPDDPRAVGVVQRNFGQPEHVAVERDALVEAAHGDADVRDRSRRR